MAASWETPGAGATEGEPKHWGQSCTRGCRGGRDRVWGTPGLGTPSPRGAQVHKAIPQQLKVRGVVGTESRSLAGMERDVNISDPRGTRPEDEEEGASGSPSSASGSSAASPACAAAGTEQRGDNQGGGTSLGFPQPHHLPCTQIWVEHPKQVRIIKRGVLGRKPLIPLKCFPSSPAGCTLLGLGAEQGDSRMLGGPCAHLLVLLPDELLCLRIGHRGDDRDGEICPALPRQFAVGQREEMRLFLSPPPKPSPPPPTQKISPRPIQELGPTKGDGAGPLVSPSP